jgi:hypothetical protein
VPSLKNSALVQFSKLVKFFAWSHAHRIHAWNESAGEFRRQIARFTQAFQPHAIARSCEVNRAVVVAMIDVRMMQMTVMQIINVIVVLDRSLHASSASTA